MESSGVVTGIRETRIPNAPVSERKKLNTPSLAELQRSGPKTREEVRAFQVTAVEIVSETLKKGRSPLDARDIDDAVEAAKTMRGVWPKAEFLARLRDAELFNKALKLFGDVEAFSAVA